jgi:hypothetical protein
MLVTPAGSLDPLRDGLRAAIAEVWSPAGVPEAQEWTPHVSVAYSRVSGPQTSTKPRSTARTAPPTRRSTLSSAYLLTDEDVTGTAARYAPARPPLDAISRRTLTAPPAVPPTGPNRAARVRMAPARPTPRTPETMRTARRHLAVRAVTRARSGTAVSELMAATGMGRRWVYYRLRELSAAGRVIQTTCGLWRIGPKAATVSNHRFAHVHPHAPRLHQTRVHTPRTCTCTHHPQ